MKRELITTLCFVLSVVLHGVLVVAGASVVWVGAVSVQAEEDDPGTDSWAGETFDIDTRQDSPVRDGRPTPRAPLPATPPPEVPREVEPPLPAPSVTPVDGPATSPDPAPSAKPDRGAPSAQPPARPPQPVSTQSAGPSPAAVASGGPQAGGQGPDSKQPGTFGAAGPARGVRNLATAFARAMPISNSGDPVWGTLPLGPAGSLEVSLEVDDEGKLVRAVPSDPARAPEHLVRLVERTLSLLRAGRFALTGTEPQAGSETFLLEARIEQVETTPEDDPSMAGPYALGFAAPRRGEPGHATFTLRTGRRVYIAIKLAEK